MAACSLHADLLHTQLTPCSRRRPARRPQFCLRLTREAGVTLIPVSAFYADRATAPRTLVRFVFCKTDEKLNTACEKLRAYFGVTARPGDGDGGGSGGRGCGAQ